MFTWKTSTFTYRNRLNGSIYVPTVKAVMDDECEVIWEENQESGHWYPKRFDGTHEEYKAMNKAKEDQERAQFKGIVPGSEQVESLKDEEQGHEGAGAVLEQEAEAAKV